MGDFGRMRQNAHEDLFLAYLEEAGLFCANSLIRTAPTFHAASGRWHNWIDWALVTHDLLAGDNVVSAMTDVEGGRVLQKCQALQRPHDHSPIIMKTKRMHYDALPSKAPPRWDFLQIYRCLREGSGRQEFFDLIGTLARDRFDEMMEAQRNYNIDQQYRIIQQILLTASENDFLQGKSPIRAERERLRQMKNASLEQRIRLRREITG